MDEHGRRPFDDWLGAMRDQRAKARILVRLDRLAAGLTGDAKSVGDGVWELRIPEGQGYRVYFGWIGQAAVLLLCGGGKDSQSRDIANAKEFWSQYHGR